ncbi:MAG: hypothetical protein U0263_36340 [Polyangiaceae bacterium]
MPISGKKLMVAGSGWYQTKTGDWVKDGDLVRVDPIKNKPGWATPGGPGSTCPSSSRR